jgi:hypothetical protein
VNPSQQGAVAEAAIAFEAAKLGIVVLKPVFEGSRYDLVFDLDCGLVRVQCKIARRRGKVVDLKARTCRRVAGGGYMRRTYGADEVDAVAAYCPDVGRCYYVRSTPFRRADVSICDWRRQKTISRLG